MLRTPSAARSNKKAQNRKIALKGTISVLESSRKKKNPTVISNDGILMVRLPEPHSSPNSLIINEKSVPVFYYGRKLGHKKILIKIKDLK
ncbi:MAG: hypothetical protein Q7T62_06270 [Undibacterium sp.]|nr:hypothetical protein [Undibacterium sp.]